MRSRAGTGDIRMGVYMTDAGRVNCTCKGPGAQPCVVCTMSWV